MGPESRVGGGRRTDWRAGADAGAGSPSSDATSRRAGAPPRARLGKARSRAVDRPENTATSGLAGCGRGLQEKEKGALQLPGH